MKPPRRSDAMVEATAWRSSRPRPCRRAASKGAAARRLRQKGRPSGESVRAVSAAWNCSRRWRIRSLPRWSASTETSRASLSSESTALRCLARLARCSATSGASAGAPLSGAGPRPARRESISASSSVRRAATWSAAVPMAAASSSSLRPSSSSASLRGMASSCLRRSSTLGRAGRPSGAAVAAAAVAAARSCAWAVAGTVRTSMARTIRPVARHWRKACAHVGRSGRGHGRGGVMDAHCAAGRRDGCFQRSGPASRQPSQRDAGLNISTRSVMTPSVPRSIRRCAAHSSLTV